MYRVFQRLFDVVVSSAAIVILSPFLVLIAAAVLIESGTPIFFKHQRLGQFGRPFLMYKFRKFRPDCSAKGLQLTMQNDNRLTRVGNFLARTKLDEIPQLLNVLRGEMAIVGPRPETVEFQDCFRSGFEEVLHYKPGIVGPSQMIFRDEAYYYPKDGNPTAFYKEVIFPTKAGIDIAYFRHRTMRSDFGWILRSGIAVLGMD